MVVFIWAPEDLDDERLRAAEERHRAAGRHHQVADHRRAAVPESHAHEALVVVILVRLPHPLAAEQPPQERERCVADERAEYEHGEPQRPQTAVPADDAERCGEET
jgi:hypothetical protein